VNKRNRAKAMPPCAVFFVQADRRSGQAKRGTDERKGAAAACLFGRNTAAGGEALGRAHADS